MISIFRTTTVAAPHFIFHPSQNGPVLEPPTVEHREGVAHMQVGRPQKQDAVFVRKVRDRESADVRDRHRRIGHVALVRRIFWADFIQPGRVCADTTIGPVARQRRRLGANAFRLLGYLQSAIDAVDLAGAVHVREQFAEALRLGRGGVETTAQQRFNPIPSQPSLQAWRNTVSPSASMCSLSSILPAKTRCRLARGAI